MSLFEVDAAKLRPSSISPLLRGTSVPELSFRRKSPAVTSSVWCLPCCQMPPTKGHSIFREKCYYVESLCGLSAFALNTRIRLTRSSTRNAQTGGNACQWVRSHGRPQPCCSTQQEAPRRTGLSSSCSACFCWVPFPGFLSGYRYFPVGPWGLPCGSPLSLSPALSDSSGTRVLRGGAAGASSGRRHHRLCCCHPHSPSPPKGHRHSLPRPGSPRGCRSSFPHSHSSHLRSGCWKGCPGQPALAAASRMRQRCSGSASAVSAAVASGNAGTTSAREVCWDVQVPGQVSDALEKRKILHTVWLNPHGNTKGPWQRSWANGMHDACRLSANTPCYCCLIKYH